MRLVWIPNLEYEQYSQIFDAIIQHIKKGGIPFALLNQGYSARLKVGFFNFWDSDYIPENLKKFILQPPRSREDKEKLVNQLNEVIASIGV